MAPPAAAPTTLTATANSAIQVTLTWRDNATTETGFNVERDVNNTGVFTLIATVARRTGTGNVTYVDASVTGSTPYSYRVAAVNGLSPSAYSNTASVTTPVLIVPAAPSNLAATAVNVTSTRDRVTLTWTDNADNETGFRVQRATNAAFTTGLNTSTVAAKAGIGTVATATQNGLARAATFWCRVAAVTNSVPSAWSNVVSVTTP